jgi:hypothetical protein
MKREISVLIVLLVTGCIVITLLASDIYAVPSFSRQTNMACNSCHSVYPQLNDFGRQFKLNGYTLTGTKTIKAESGKGRSVLDILDIPPLSAMMQVSLNHLNTKIPATQNNNVEFPQQMSFFLSGKISPHLGDFLQITYDDQGAAFGMDNTDIRFASQTTVDSRNLIYGISLNNNPTVQDVWNSTPAWGFPYASSGVAPAPAAATLIEGGLAQAVAGLGAYGFYDNLIYGEFSVYRSAPQGIAQPPDSTASGIVTGVSPYWRLVLQRYLGSHYLSAGTFGLASELYQSGVSGSQNNYDDIGFDMQYEHNMGNNNITAHITYISEKQKYGGLSSVAGSANSKNLNSFKIDGQYYLAPSYVAYLAYFRIWGDKNTALYTPQSVFGSQTGKPDSGGLIAQLTYLPWYNTKFSLQYVYYNKFNGGDKNYDGYGRNASDNSTLYLLAWLMF